ncbi:MAG: autotransporter domain-containing protein [Xanthobacteraceae bacterium]|nr:autotransporter domain-containing protein [Xanthobacteraceae bacterium]
MHSPANRNSGAGSLRVRGARLALLSGTALAGAAFCIATSATPALACSPEPCTWIGAQDNSWSQANNWSNGVPGTGDSVLLTNAGSAPTNHDQNPAYNSVTLNPNAAGYTINNVGGNPIVLQSGGSINDNNTAAGSPGDTLNTGLTVNGPATIILASGAAGLTFGANPITGTGPLTIINNSTGSVTLNAVNTYTGDTNISKGTVVLGLNGELPSSTALTVNSGATLSIADTVQTTIGSLAGAGSVVIGPSAHDTVLEVGGIGASTTFSGAITGAGSLFIQGSGTLALTGTGNNIGGDLNISACGCSVAKLRLVGGSMVVGRATTVEDGVLAVSNGGTLTTKLLGVAGGMTIDGPGSTVTVTNTLPTAPSSTSIGLFGPGNLTISNGGVLNSLGTAEIDLLFGTAKVTVTGAGSQWNVGDTLAVGTGSSGGAGTLTISNGAVVNATGPVMTIGDITGSSFVTVTGAGSTLNASHALVVGDFAGNFPGTLTIANGATVNSPGFTGIGFGSTLNLGTGGLAGSIITAAIDNRGTIAANFTDTLTLSAAISDIGSISKAGSGTLILSGISSYTGATTVNGGTLSVTGDISSSSGVTVNSGAMLNGTGIVSSVTVNNGGTLAPGLSPSQITINGNLGMASAAIYLIQISPTAASRANVSGSANIGGAVDVVAGPGNYLPGAKYTILTTAGGPVTGTFSGVSIVGAPNVRPVLSYDANDVYLNLVQALLPPVPNLSINQQNVLGALNAFINSGGSLPAGFQNLYNLSPSLLAQALTQLEGQNNAGGAQQAGYQLMNEFLLLMLNPFDSDRAGFGGAGFGAGAGQFAPDQDRDLPPDVAAAYAAATPYYKAPIAPAPKRWNVWAAAFGGSNNTNGDPNGVGSVNFSAQTGAVAGGVDYKLTPDTMIGVALAGGGTSWGLAQGLGSGHSDAFQAGLYGSQRFGAWYVSAAAAFANYWASTTRNLTLPAIDTLNANFNAESWGGRVEGGYRFAWGTVNVTPYAAFQAQSFSTPNYSEASGSGSNQFALSYASRTGNVERGELGSWVNTLYLLQGNSVVSLFGRAAWAHDWQNTPQASATFLGVSPIAAFIVNGAKPAADLGVVTAGAELRMASGWALMGKFDGEFGSGTQTYAGTARARYVW